jgi:hypothetical protein
MPSGPLLGSDLESDSENQKPVMPPRRVLVVCGRWTHTHSTYRILHPIVVALQQRFRVRSMRLFRSKLL